MKRSLTELGYTYLNGEYERTGINGIHNIKIREFPNTIYFTYKNINIDCRNPRIVLNICITRNYNNVSREYICLPYSEKSMKLLIKITEIVTEAIDKLLSLETELHFNQIF